MQLVRVSIAMVVAALVIAVPAFGAGNSTLKAGYATTPHNVAGAVAKSPAVTKGAVSPAKSTGTLPFTGTDLGLFAAAAVALGVTGLVFRRLGRQPS
jgi:hypothetical protein